jgi:hypothetical protein
MTTQILDCLVSYFGLDEDEQPGLRRYFCYHILAGPGPTAGTGVAAIQTLAVHNETERCTSCHHFHTSGTGGPAEAIAAAIRYLDSYHERDHVLKVASEVRGLDDAQHKPGFSTAAVRADVATSPGAWANGTGGRA